MSVPYRNYDPIMEKSHMAHFPIGSPELYTYDQIFSIFGRSADTISPQDIPEAFASTAAQPKKLAYAFLRIPPQTNVHPNGPTVFTFANHKLLSRAADNDNNQNADACFPVFREPWQGRINMGQRMWHCLGWFKVTDVTFLEPASPEIRRLAYAYWNQANVDQMGFRRYTRRRVALVTLEKLGGRPNPMAGAPAINNDTSPSSPLSSSAITLTDNDNWAVTTTASTSSASASVAAGPIDSNEAYIRRLHAEVMRDAPKDLTQAMRYTWGVVARERAREFGVDFEREPEVEVHGEWEGEKLELATEGWTAEGEEKGKAAGDLRGSEGSLAEGKTLLD